MGFFRRMWGYVIGPFRFLVRQVRRGLRKVQQIIGIIDKLIGGADNDADLASRVIRLLDRVDEVLKRLALTPETGKSFLKWALLELVEILAGMPDCPVRVDAQVLLDLAVRDLEKVDHFGATTVRKALAKSRGSTWVD